MIKTTSNTLRVEDIHGALQTSKSGSLVMHIGLVRNRTGDKPVSAVVLERTDSTEQDLDAIETQVRETWPAVQDVIIAHRFGQLSIGEIICIVAVSTPHRQAAFEACSFALDRIKGLHSMSLIEIGP